MNTKTMWTKKEDHFILSNPNMKNATIAEHLGRSKRAVELRKNALNNHGKFVHYTKYKNNALNKNKRSTKNATAHYRKWTEVEDQFILDHVNMPRIDMANILKRSISAVSNRVNKLRS